LKPGSNHFRTSPATRHWIDDHLQANPAPELMPEGSPYACPTAQQNHSSAPGYFEPCEKAVLDGAYLWFAHTAKKFQCPNPRQRGRTLYQKSAGFAPPCAPARPQQAIEAPDGPPKTQDGKPRASCVTYLLDGWTFEIRLCFADVILDMLLIAEGTNRDMHLRYWRKLEIDVT
jgi:hypothetical protein